MVFAVGSFARRARFSAFFSIEVSIETGRAAARERDRFRGDVDSVTRADGAEIARCQRKGNILDATARQAAKMRMGWGDRFVDRCFRTGDFDFENFVPSVQARECTMDGGEPDPRATRSKTFVENLRADMLAGFEPQNGVENGLIVGRQTLRSGSPTSVA